MKLNELGCLKEDRLAFNGNVIRVFVAEYTRSRQNMHNEKPVALSDKMIIDWKFSMLDSNHNRILEKYEYRELKRIVKKVRIGKILDELFWLKVAYFKYSNSWSSQNVVHDHSLNSAIWIETNESHEMNGAIVYQRNFCLVSDNFQMSNKQKERTAVQIA